METECLLDLESPQEAAQEPTAPKETEPRVVTADVSAVLRRIVRPEDDDSGESVALIAERADTSTRTVYRILSVSTETVSLDLADRCCLAADTHLSACRLSWPNGDVTPYFSWRVAEG